MDLVRGAAPGSTITAGLEVVGKIFGEDVNKEITKVRGGGALVHVVSVRDIKKITGCGSGGLGNFLTKAS